MECAINGITLSRCNSNDNILFVDNYKEVFFDVYNLEIDGKTIIAELVENTKTGPIVSVRDLTIGDKTYKNTNFLVIKEKADIRIHLNEAAVLSGKGYTKVSKQEVVTPLILEKTIVEQVSKPVDVSTQVEINKIKEQALANIKLEKDKLLLLKEEINKANVDIDAKVEEYKAQLLDSFYDIVESNKGLLEASIDSKLSDVASQLKETNNENYVNDINAIVKKHVDTITEHYSDKDKALLANLNDKISSNILDISNVLEGKVNLAIKTISEDNASSIEEKTSKILEHVNVEISNATKSLNTILEDYKTGLLDNYLQTLQNQTSELEKSAKNAVSNAVTELKEQNQNDFNKQSSESISKSVNELNSVIEKSKIEFNREMRDSLRNVTEDVSGKIVNSFNSEKVKLEETIEQLNSEATDIFKSLKDNVQKSLNEKLKTVDSSIEELTSSKNLFVEEITNLVEQFKGKIIKSIDDEKVIIDEKIEKLDAVAKTTEETVSKLKEQLQEQIKTDKETLVNEVDTYLHEVAIDNKNTVSEKIEELQKKINDSLLEVNIDTVYNKFIQEYGNKVDVAITEFINSKKKIIKEEFEEMAPKPVTQDFDVLIKAQWDKKEQELLQKVKQISAVFAQSYSGGGSVAVQYANGGEMNGNLNVNGQILSGGVDLSSIFSTGGGGGGGNAAVNTAVITSSANWNQSYSYFTWLTANSSAQSDYSSVSALILGDLTNLAGTSANWNTSYSYFTWLTANSSTQSAYSSVSALILGDLTNLANTSANWNNTYTQFSTNSATYATIPYVNTNFLSTSGGTVNNNLTVYRDLSVLGNLFVTGSATFGNTIITTSSALSVVNTGPGPALYISQGPGGGDIASFYDSSNGQEVLHIGNDTPWIAGKGVIGIRTSNPNETLTVIGGISSTGLISTSAINSSSDKWSSAFTYINANSSTTTAGNSNYLPLSGGTLTGGLSAKTLSASQDVVVNGGGDSTKGFTLNGDRGNIFLGNNTRDARTIFSTNSLPSYYSGLQITRSGTELWFAGADYTEKYVIRGNNTTDFFTIDNTGGASLYSNLTASGNAYIAGNVGVGTTRPARILSINGGALTTYLQLCNTATGTTAGNGLELIMDSAGLNATITNRENGYLALETNNTERIRIDSSGNVGVGTSSPATKLDVTGTTAAFGIAGTGVNITIREYSVSTARNWSIRDDNGVDRLRFSRGSTDQVFWDITKVAASDQTADQFWYTNGAQRMQLSSSGLSVIGIGSFTGNLTLSNSSGAPALQINDGSSIGGNARIMYFTNTGASSKYNWIVGAQYNIDNAFEITPSTAAGGSTYSTPALLINSSRNVGIGTTSPAGKLDVQASSGAGLSAYFRGGTYSDIAYATGIRFVVPPSTNNANRQFRFQSGDASLTIQGIDGSGANTSDTNLLLQPNGGNVGIGTSSPSSLLDIETSSQTAEISLNQTGASGRDYRLGSTGSGYGSVGNFIIYDATAGAERFRINNNGNLAITAGKYINFNGNATAAEYSIEAATNASPYDFRFIGSSDSVTNRNFSFGYYTSNSNSSTWNPKVTINSYTGNVGIGTISPAQKLDVNGSIAVGGKKAVNGPAFGAYADATAQNITSGSQQKVLFQTEEFDTDNCFANSRFTPNVEGYYQLNSEVRLDGSSGTGEIMIVLHKNNSELKRGTNQSGTSIGTNFFAQTVSALVYANGTTDYFEIKVQQTSGSTLTVTAVNNPAITWFNGAMVRGA